MSTEEIRATGRQALSLATCLLQRVRLAHPLAGMWEAADVQWWSRKARPSDDLEQVFWCDEQGPVAGVLLTCWGEDSWQCDPITVPGVTPLGLDVVWAKAEEQITAHTSGAVEVPVADDQRALRDLVEASGLVAGEEYGIAWLDAADRPAVLSPGEGFVLADRTQRQGTLHPMRQRSGDAVEERLSRCSLYDPALDLVVETIEGKPAGYSVYWFDPVTRVGLVEPVRVEDEYGRRGLARAMLTAGIERLAQRGAERIKIGFGSGEAAALYQSVGFRPTSFDAWYEGPGGATPLSAKPISRADCSSPPPMPLWHPLIGRKLPRGSRVRPAQSKGGTHRDHAATPLPTPSPWARSCGRSVRTPDCPPPGLTLKQVLDNALRDADGTLLDANTLERIEGPYHVGHRYNHEWWRIRDMARQENWSRQQLYDYINNPDLYQIELPANNLSHRFEAPR